MMKSVWTAIEIELESELINTGHMTALLMKQLFQQAEKVHMRMTPQINEIENKLVIRSLWAEISCIVGEVTLPNIDVFLKKWLLMNSNRLDKKIQQGNALNQLPLLDQEKQLYYKKYRCYYCYLIIIIMCVGD